MLSLLPMLQKQMQGHLAGPAVLSRLTGSWWHSLSVCLSKLLVLLFCPQPFQCSREVWYLIEIKYCLPCLVILGLEFVYIAHLLDGILLLIFGDPAGHHLGQL